MFRMGLAEGIDIFYFPASVDSASKIRAASFAVFFSAERVFHRCRRSFMHVVVVSGWGPFSTIIVYSFSRSISHLTFSDGDINQARQFNLKGQRQPYW